MRYLLGWASGLPPLSGPVPAEEEVGAVLVSGAGYWLVTFWLILNVGRLRHPGVGRALWRRCAALRERELSGDETYN